MFSANLSRLLWQIPVLVLLVAALMPETTWTSNAFGLWPVWLLSMPLMATMRYVYLERNKQPKRHFVNQSQVLVFQKKPANTRLNNRDFSQAA
jgi:hypothetical protein